MITFWWEQMEGMIGMDLRGAAVRPRFPCLDVLGVVHGHEAFSISCLKGNPFARLLNF